MSWMNSLPLDVSECIFIIALWALTQRPTLQMGSMQEMLKDHEDAAGVLEEERQGGFI